MEDHLLYRMLKFGMANERFTKSQISTHLGDKWDADYFENICHYEAGAGPHTVFFMYYRYKYKGEIITKRNPPQGVTVDTWPLNNSYSITPQAASHFLEMQELREARKASKLATILALLSVIIAVVTILINLLSVQEVRVISDPNHPSRNIDQGTSTLQTN